MRHLLLSIAFMFALVVGALFVAPQPAQAQVCDATTLGNCINGKRCIERYDPITQSMIFDLGGDCGGSAIVGGVRPPKGVLNYNVSSGSIGNIGIIAFFSNILRLATIIAGIWVMFNIIAAGYMYVTSNGDAAAHGKVTEKITYSVLGILIIVVAYTLAGLIGLIFFGNAGFILNPDVTTIQEVKGP